MWSPTRMAMEHFVAHKAHFRLDGGINTHYRRIWTAENEHQSLKMAFYFLQVTVWRGCIAKFILYPFYFVELPCGIFRHRLRIVMGAILDSGCSGKTMCFNKSDYVEWYSPTHRPLRATGTPQPFLRRRSMPSSAVIFLQLRLPDLETWILTTFRYGDTSNTWSTVVPSRLTLKITQYAMWVTFPGIHCFQKLDMQFYTFRW